MCLNWKQQSNKETVKNIGQCQQIDGASDWEREREREIGKENEEASARENKWKSQSIKPSASRN